MKAKSFRPFILSDKMELTLSILLYMVLTLLYLHNIFSKLYINLTGDSFFSFYSWNTFFRNCVTKGLLPLWNPLVLCGQPYHLESVSNFSLSNALLLFLDVNRAWNVKLFFSTVFTGWCMFFFLRKHLKLSAISAFVGGAIFMFLSIDIVDNPQHFLPLIFIFANKWINTKKFLWSFMLAISIAVYLLNANPHFVLYVCIFVYGYILFKLIHESKPCNIKKILVFMSKAATPFFIAFGLASIRIIPVMEMLNISSRAHAGTFLHILPLTNLIDLLYNNFYMSSLNPQLNFFPGRIMDAIASFMFGPDRINFIRAPYIGILPFILALITVVKKNKIFIEKFFIYSSAVILLYVIFNPLLYMAIIRHLPLLKHMPFISRVYIIYNFSMVVLASIAVDNLLNKNALKSDNLKKLLSLFFWFLAFLIFLKVTAHIILVLFGNDILSLLVEKILPFISRQSFFKASCGFYYNRLQQFFVFLQSWASVFNSYFTVPTILFAYSLALLYFYLKNKIRRILFVVFATGIIFTDLFFNFDIPAFPLNEIVTRVKTADFINSQPGIFRVMPLLQNYNVENPPPMEVRSFLRPESNMIYDIMTPEGYRSFSINRYIDVMKLLTRAPAKNLKFRIGEFEDIDDRIADLLNIKYIVTPSPGKFRDGYRLVYRDDEHSLFLNEDVLPRAFLVHSIKIAKTRQEALELLKSNIDFRDVAILEAGIEHFKNAGKKLYSKEKVTIEKYEPNKIIINVQNPQDGFLVLSDSYYPGWKAYINGKLVPVIRANYIFRAVRVPEGEHVVEFIYSPNSVKLGLLISVLFLFGGFILCFFIKKF